MESNIFEKELKNLQPSYELLNHYRQKVLQAEKNSEEIKNLLDRYKSLTLITEFQNERECLLDDLEELRVALSDVNIFIHAERQQVAKLLLEIEILKTDKQLAERKIDILLQLSGLTKQQLQAYLRSKKAIKITDSAKLNRSHFIEQPFKDDRSLIEENLEKRIELLGNNFKAAKQSWEEEKNSVLQDRALRESEYKASHEQYKSQIKLLTNKLEEAQKVAYDATKKAVNAKQDAQKSHFIWLAEKDSLMEKIGSLARYDVDNKESWKTHSIGHLHATPLDSCEVRYLKKDVNSLKKELRECEELKVLYESRCRKLEQEFCSVRDKKEDEISLLKEKVHKFYEAKELYKKQREKLEERRRIEAEGFSNELKLVKNDLRHVIQQFFKLTNFYSENEDLTDLKTIKDFKLASSLARNVHLSIIEAKNKMLNTGRAPKRKNNVYVGSVPLANDPTQM